MPAPEPAPSTADLVRIFGRIGLLSFGGPAAQIALMHRELVDRLKWLTERQFLGALGFCMLLPGPEAMQLATYAGWRLGGVRGGLIAGGLFVLPGAAVILALSIVYAWFGQTPVVAALFLGIKAAVVVIVIEALLRLARRALGGAEYWAVAGLAFLGIFLLALPFPLIVALAALWGFFRTRGDMPSLPEPPRSAAPIGRTLALWSGLWLGPVAALWLAFPGVYAEIALFFSKLAVVTFGGAYAVLAYMTQHVVQEQGWITTGEMIDGLGLAETTPGPLILVTQFVGFLAAFREHGLWGGVAGAALTLWVTFVPCFLWIFAGAPHIERITTQPRLAGALAAVTAAVVGVVLNLSLWFAAHVFFAEVAVARLGPLHLLVPSWASLSLPVVAIAALSALLLLWRHWPLPTVLGVAALAGLGIGTPGP